MMQKQLDDMNRWKKATFPSALEWMLMETQTCENVRTLQFLYSGQFLTLSWLYSHCYSSQAL